MPKLMNTLHNPPPLVSETPDIPGVSLQSSKGKKYTTRFFLLEVDVSIDIFLCMACMTFIFSPTYSARPGQCYRYPQWRYLMRRKFFKGWKRFFSSPKVVYFALFQPVLTVDFRVSRLKNHHWITFWFLKCKLRVVWVCWLLCLKDMILTKPSRKNFEFQWLEKNFLETSKVREAIFQNSLFELILTEPGWFLVSRLKNHHWITFWILKCKLRVVWVCWLLCLKDMILTKPSRKNFEFQWLEKIFLETSKVSGDFWALRLKINLVQSKSIQKESFGRWLLWLCWSLKTFFQVTETQNSFGKALLGAYLSNKVTNTLIRCVVCILESKTWSSGDFWALRPKINLVQSG